jgi:hypothetical protein
MGEGGISSEALQEVENRLVNIEQFLTAQLAYAGIALPRE